MSWGADTDFGSAVPSRHSITTRFGQECAGFSSSLYKIFVHAVMHVYSSIHCHLHNPTFKSRLTPTSQQFTMLGSMAQTHLGSMAQTHDPAPGGEDVDMENSESKSHAYTLLQ